MQLPYNHVDPVPKRRPLPIRLGPVPIPVAAASKAWPRRIARVAIDDECDIAIELRTDSEHLACFFAENWATCDSAAAPQGTLIALKEPAVSYGLPAELDGSRWFCPETRTLWWTGSEYYGNVKIGVRGLCSELAPDDLMFHHGCVLEAHGQGLLLCGRSGAGKTTITAELLAAFDDARVVNDDWGALSLSTGRAVSTEEQRLHMKYPSVATLAAHLQPSPSTHPSENFHGDRTDPHARLLIRGAEVFRGRILPETRVQHVVVLLRDASGPPHMRLLGRDDLPLLEAGSYSAFYKRHEPFLNGSLLLLRDCQRVRQRQLHTKLLETTRCIVVNNSGSPQEIAGLITAHTLGDSVNR